MASEILNEVLKAEKAAAAAELEITNKADIIIKDAALQAAAIIKAKIDEAQAAADAVLLKVRENAFGIESAAVKSAESECERITAAAKAKQKEAVDAAIELILH